MIETKRLSVENQGSGNVNVTIRPENQAKPEHPYFDFAVINTLTNENVKSIGGLSILWQIAPDKEITGDCWRVLACLLCKLDYDNFLLISQPKLAEHLGISRSTISKCLKILCTKGILERGERIGNTPTFRFNPQLAWKGENGNLKFALHQKLGTSPRRKRNHTSQKPND